MRVNVYAEEMTNRVVIIEKEVDGMIFTGVRFYLELPVTMPVYSKAGTLTDSVYQAKGPFMHHPGDDDSAAITFWGKQSLRDILKSALELLDEHYKESEIRQARLNSKR